jgi:iron-sulfur cluster assembly accessory protein
MDNHIDSLGRFGLTDRAAARIAEIVAASGGPDALRVAVLAGGCSGFQYKFELDNAVQPDDVVIERGPARVLVDSASLDLLAGAELDYTDELMGSHFAVRNPNATSACGCGTSFSLPTVMTRSAATWPSRATARRAGPGWPRRQEAARNDGMRRFIQAGHQPT